MHTQTQHILTATISEVLESLAFMFTEPVEEEIAIDGECLEAAICYSGPIDGGLTFRCPHEFAVLLAANLLGLDSASEAARVAAEDATKELMNIVCGQFITARHGRDHVFNLSIPTSRRLQNPTPLCSGDEAEYAALNVDGHRVEILHTLIP